MNIYLNYFVSHTFSSCQENLSLSLNAQQKRIIIIASLAFSLFAICYKITQYCFTAIAEYEQRQQRASKCQWSIKKTKIFPWGKWTETQSYHIKIDGEGAITFPNGITEKGKFQNGLLNGLGERIHPDGRIEKGIFVNGVLTLSKG